MFYPHITIAVKNYLDRGILLCVTTLGRRAVLRAMNANRIDEVWYQHRPCGAFLQGDYVDTKYDGRTLMFIENMAPPTDVNAWEQFDEYIKIMMDQANDTNGELHKLAKFAMDVHGEEYNY